MAKKFQKYFEDFICEKCGFRVQGDGYTNHCPECLWSKHVDVNPGDRAAKCHGLMEPESLELLGQEYIIQHRCLRCGFEKKNKSIPNDSMEAIVELSAKQP